jgi:hypothetical protein
MQDLARKKTQPAAPEAPAAPAPSSGGSTPAPDQTPTP